MAACLAPRTQDGQATSTGTCAVRDYFDGCGSLHVTFGLAPT
jgi:hypothetical protein